MRPRNHIIITLGLLVFGAACMAGCQQPILRVMRDPIIEVTVGTSVKIRGFELGKPWPAEQQEQHDADTEQVLEETSGTMTLIEDTGAPRGVLPHDVVGGSSTVPPKPDTRGAPQ